jgi:hypothetical protein
MLASEVGVRSWQKGKSELIKQILKEQHSVRVLDPLSGKFCEMCGHFVSNTQKAHIVSEGVNSMRNLLRLCPSCHLMFDSRLKPRLYQAL